MSEETTNEMQEPVEEPKELTEEEKADQARREQRGASIAVGRMLTWYLLKNVAAFQEAALALTNGRKLYLMAYKDIEHRIPRILPNERGEILAAAKAAIGGLAENQDKNDELEKVINLADMDAVWNQLHEFVVSIASGSVSTAFTGTELKFTLEASLGWLDKVNVEHDKWEDFDSKHTHEALEQARRDRGIPLPVGINWELGAKNELPRSQTLVFYGWAPAVQWVLDEIAANALAFEDGFLYNVVRLSRNAIVDDKHIVPRYVKLSKTTWSDCCRSNTSWPQLFASSVLPKLVDPPDVVMIDDLSLAGESLSLIGSSRPRCAGSAHKRFRQWGNAMGCAVIAGLPMESNEPVAIDTPDWDQLRTFATPRLVRAVEDGENYRIVIGNNVSEFGVPKSVLESYGSQLVTNMDFETEEG